ncbi:metallophosphoesterase family protein [Salinibacillus xinjiangensis]|uniref:PhoD-like phosphatase metallophosphatase domain-containing protein n=1 Tax=Salinibacillus xinjiangensis TaxID=1229268 RepID=A0A6G1X5Y0_9BACI|nr:hypothetical protein [Salinibacillus xinjiangensis]MRG86347.1 hypothetical protein [Salinibacillus xinjiangensis]
MMTLPNILLGPIIRRVSLEEVYIWIATSKRFNIEAEVYHVNQSGENETTYKPVSNKSKPTTIQAGAHLFFHLIKVSPAGRSFPTDTLLGYNLFFTEYGSWLDLGDFQLLSHENPNSIVYGDLDYPTFIIPHENPTNILYGSCRKPHSEGEDTLVGADIKLQQTHLHLEDRPNTLFMMGDQIYADDVAGPLFPVITSWAKELMGRKREEKLTKVDPRLVKSPFHSAIDKLNGRQYITEKFCKFTSGKADNHLFRFHEYVAMYLFMFGTPLCEIRDEKDSFPSFEQLLIQNQVYFIFSGYGNHSNERIKELEETELRYEEQLKAIRLYAKNLPRIRRVLANTPTYMIFDDHDITDDWNLSLEWKNNVKKSPLGRHVVANGLSAYFLFQGWGNDPDSFDHYFIDTVSDYFKNFSSNSHTYTNWINLLWEFHTWHFTAPTKPKSLFLDTRTMRKYELDPQPIQIEGTFKEMVRAPQMIDEKGWKDVNNRLANSGWNRGEPLILVSPSPVYGVGLIENLLQGYMYPLRSLGLPVRFNLDFEGWSYNEKGFHRLIQQISQWNPNPCYILSGDVHYGTALKSFIRTRTGQKNTLYQFTSSPIQNISFSGLWGFLIKRAVWFKSLKRKQNTIYRAYDQHEDVYVNELPSSDAKTLKWREKMDYLRLENGSVMETDNHMGLLSVQGDKVDSCFIKYNGKQKREIKHLM